MRKLAKKNLMSLCALLAVAAIPVAVTSINTANADTTTPTATEFYMTEGAAVRTTAGELGIRFTATITEGYWEELRSAYGADATYNFYSVVTDGTTPITKEYGNITPDFTEDANYELYSTIIYTTEELESANLLEAACNLSLSATTYLDITKAGETEATTITAYGTTGARSMKAVANAAALAGEADEELQKYFTVGKRNETAEGYVFADNSGIVTMKALPDLTEATDMEVYYGAQKLTATYANGQISFEGVALAEGQNQAYISVFTGGKVYSSKVVKATKITQNNVDSLLTITGNETVYLAEDVDLTGKTWNSTANFSGTFDGGNHAIKNLTTVAYNAFFLQAQGTIKNVAFVNAKLTGAKTATIVYNQVGHLYFNNVFVQLNGYGSGTYAGALLFNEAKPTTEVRANMTDVVVSYHNTYGNYKLVGYMFRGQSLLTNVHQISGSGKLFHTNSNHVLASSTTYHYANLEAFGAAQTTLTSFLRDCVKDYLGVAKIYQENATDLLTLKGTENVYLMEDIDLAGITWNTAVAFKGVFNGLNHAIKNLTTVSGKGFFASVQGTIKNVAFVDVFTGVNSAVIANKPTGTLTLENIFIDIKGKEGWSGATLYTSGDNKAEYAANMTNVVVNFSEKSTYYNLFGYTLKGMSTLTNVHIVSGSGLYARMNDASKVYVKAGSTVTFHPDLTAFNTAEKELTDFLTNCVATYLNA